MLFADLGGSTDVGSCEGTTAVTCSDDVAFDADSFATLVNVAMFYYLRVLDRNCITLKNGGKISQNTKDLSSAYKPYRIILLLINAVKSRSLLEIQRKTAIDKSTIVLDII